MKDLNTKFRPQDWESFKGQTKTVKVLRNQAMSKSPLAHCYLFHGPSGVGKTTLARLFFRALICTKITKNGNPCLKCDNCKNIGFHLTEVNAADNRSIDDIRALVRSSYLQPFGKYKGYILDECHMLTNEAWNCLLKPLEEPPEEVIWFLVTSKLDKIDTTILTRCQNYEFEPHASTQIIARLREIADGIHFKVSDYKLRKIAGNSGKNLRQAIHQLEQNCQL